jgi:two-component system, OmpR family, phosphate regulon response regulator PhoB
VTSVLVVDDERDLLTSVDFNLRAAGFETLLATTGEQALAQI